MTTAKTITGLMNDKQPTLTTVKPAPWVRLMLRGPSQSAYLTQSVYFTVSNVYTVTIL